jgi:AcrR family transcriptional regulator
MPEARSGQGPAHRLRAMATPATTARRLPRPERRAAILRAVAPVLAERPYDAISMTELVDAAGVSRPVLYDHFPTKRDLVLGLIAEHHERLVRTVAAVTDGEGAGAGERRLRRVLDAVFQHCEADVAGWRLLCQDLSRDPEVAVVQRRCRDEINGSIASVFGLRGAPAQRMLAAEAIRTGVNGLFAWRLEHPEVTRAELVDVAVELLWRPPAAPARG